MASAELHSPIPRRRALAGAAKTVYKTVIIGFFVFRLHSGLSCLVDVKYKSTKSA